MSPSGLNFAIARAGRGHNATDREQRDSWGDRKFADRPSTGAGLVAENAARLCDASDAQIWQVKGDKYWRVASYGSIPS